MELNEASTQVIATGADERMEEQKLIRRLQMMMNMVMQVGWLADRRRCGTDDRRQPKGGTRNVSW